jgi:trehalose 6-phosphate phosphatase
VTETPRTDNPVLSAIALFLDVDGTLLEIAARPQAVSVPAELRELLRGLSRDTGGAVALVSGRAIGDLDTLFDPLTLPSAGLHGFEHRGASGVYCRHAAPSAAALGLARSAMQQLAQQHPGLLVEDKQFALALHYRGAPQLEDTVLAAMREVGARLRGEFELQRGKKVVELRPAGATKAKAVAAYLEEAPFAGRMPIFLGDDLTDEPAFELVNHRQGLSVLVGEPRPSAARARLGDVAAARAWLAELQARPAAALRRLAGAAPEEPERGEPARQDSRGWRLRSQAR